MEQICPNVILVAWFLVHYFVPHFGATSCIFHAPATPYFLCFSFIHSHLQSKQKRGLLTDTISYTFSCLSCLPSVAWRPNCANSWRRLRLPVTNALPFRQVHRGLTEEASETRRITAAVLARWQSAQMETLLQSSLAQTSCSSCLAPFWPSGHDSRAVRLNSMVQYMFLSDY